MTTITKEWLQQTIAEFENTHDDIPFGLSDDDAKILIVLKRALAALTAEPVAWTDAEELRDLRTFGFCEMFTVEPVSKDADMYRVIPLYTVSQPVPERERIRREHAEWSDATFGDVGPIGPLKHLSKEALEAAADPSDPLEWADMQFLLWDAQRRMGISDEFITRAMIEKLEINKSRQWPEPKDGEPRLHIKEQSVPVVRQIMRELVSLLDEDQFARIENIALSAGVMPPQPAPVVPEEIPKGLAGQIVSLLAHNIGDKFLAQKIWNTCRAAMLQGAEPVSQTYELPELIEGMEVSIDVSTCDADAGNRYFGTVTEVSELDIAKNGYILLVQDAEPNFDVNGNSPVIPGGYALVPAEPTDEMIAAAMNCDDVVFDSQDPTAFRVQFREIYCSMLAAAPEPEQS